MVTGATVPCCDKRNGGFVGDLGLGRRGVDDEDERLARALAKVDRGADGAKVVRARPGRDDDQLGDLDDALYGERDRRRRVDHGELEALPPKHFQVGGEPRDRRLGERRHLRLALVPPVGERPLGVDVDQADGTRAGPLRLHGEVAGQGRLARSAFL
jgi:hypothetical protein